MSVHDGRWRGPVAVIDSAVAFAEEDSCYGVSHVLHFTAEDERKLGHEVVRAQDEATSVLVIIQKGRK